MKTSQTGFGHRLLPLLLSLLLAACGGNPGGGGPTSGTVNTPGGQAQVALQGGSFTQGPTAVQVNAPGFQTPYGGIGFTAQVPQAGGTLTVTLTFPQDLPQGAVLLKCLSGNCTPIQEAQLQGRTATFQVRDGGPWDADGQANGRVVDPVALGVPIPPDFTLSLSPTSLTVEQGGSGSTTLTLTPQNGFTGQVALSLEGQDGSPAPQGITLSPNSVNVTGANPVTQTLTLTVGQGVAPGSYALRVKATAGSILRTADLTLQVPLGPLVWLGPGRAYDVSDDGSVVVGEGPQGGGYVWRVGSTGVTPLRVSDRLFGVSGDGQRAVGGAGRLVIWDAQRGGRSLHAGDWGWLFSITPDGRLAVGKHRDANSYMAIVDVERALQEPNYQATRYLPSGFVDAEAYGISDDGRSVVGIALTSLVNPPCPSGGMKVDLDNQGNPLGYTCLANPPGAAWSVALGIYTFPSGDTVLVGRAVYYGGADYLNYPILWRSSNAFLPGFLQTLSSHVYGAAYKIRGDWIVGFLADSPSLNDADTRAVRWRSDRAETQVEDLNTTYAHLLQDGSKLEMATSISRNGCYIVGQGYNASTNQREAFRLDTCR